MTSLSRLRAWPRVAALFTVCSVLHAGTCQHGAHRLHVKAEQNKKPHCPESVTQDSTTQVREVPWQGEEEERKQHTLPLLGGMHQPERPDGDVKAHARTAAVPAIPHAAAQRILTELCEVQARQKEDQTNDDQQVLIARLDLSKGELGLALTKLLCTAASRADVEVGIAALIAKVKELEEVQEDQADSAQEHHTNMLAHLELMKSELGLAFQKSRQALQGKISTLLEAVSGGHVQTQQAVRRQVESATQSLQQELKRQGGRYDQLLNRALGHVQQRLLARIEGLQQSTLSAADLRGIFTEYGLAPKIDRIDEGVQELVQAERRRQRENANREHKARLDEASLAMQSQTELKKYYQTHYSTIRSFFQGDQDWPIQDSYIQLAIVAREEVRKKEKEKGPKGMEKEGIEGEAEQQEDIKEAAAHQDEVRDQLLESYESIHAIKKDIKLEELFETRKLRDDRQGIPKKILLVGRAGIGKTTLCHKLAHLWASGQWYQDKFEAVYILPVRNLKKAKYNGADLRSQRNLETAIAQECCNGAALDDETFQQLTQYIKGQLKHRSEKVLIVLDGLDERSGASDEIIGQAKSRGKDAHRLWVSRPYGVDEERRKLERDNEALLVENIGFSHDQVVAYVKTYFRNKGAERGEALLKFLLCQPAIRGIAHIPINLQILCALWADASNKEAFEKAASGSMVGLYDTLCNYVWKRYKQCVATAPKPAVQEKLYQVLGKIALAGLQAGELLIGGETVEKIVEASKQDENRLKTLLGESGFLRQTETGERYFLHLTFQEYFAGRALAHAMLSECDEEQKAAVRFLQANQFKRQYHAMLVFMAGEVGKLAQAQGMQQLLKLMGEASESEMVGFQSLLLQLRCANELLGQGTVTVETFEKVCPLIDQLLGWIKKGFEHIRKSKGEGITLYSVILEASTGISAMIDSEKIMAFYTQTMLRSWSPFVRAYAARALGVLTPNIASRRAVVFRALLKAVEDAHLLVRQSASSALGELVKADHSLVPLTLEALQKAVEDNNWYVRQGIASVLGEVVKADHSLASSMLETLLKATGGQRYAVCQSTASALGELFKADARQASRALEVLLKDPKTLYTLLTPSVEFEFSSNHPRPRFRSGAAIVLEEIVKADPSQAPKVLEVLLKASEDKNDDVRRAAILALRDFVSVTPSELPKVLEVLLKASEDKKNDDNVRFAVAIAFGELVKAHACQASEVLEALVKDNSEDAISSASIIALGDIAKDDTGQRSKVLAILFKALKANSEAVVRFAAVLALGEFAKADPKQAPRLLEVLLKIMVEEVNWRVRQAAVLAFEDLVKVMPQQAEAALSALLHLTKTPSRNLRQGLVARLLGLAKVAPQQREAAIKALIELLAKDSSYKVCSQAAEALVELTKGSPTHAKEVVKALLKASKAFDDEVRIAAANALVKLVKVAPMHAEEVYKVLLRQTRDILSKVRVNAVAALGSLVAVAPQYKKSISKVIFELSLRLDPDVCSAAADALSNFSIRELLEAYCREVSPRDAITFIVRHIMTRLYTQPLVVAPSQDKDHYQLTLYQSTGQPIVWEAPKWPIDKLQSAIKRKCPGGKGVCVIQ